MCTAVTYRTRDHYFGRTLDIAAPYQEAVVVTPRQYPFRFRHCGLRSRSCAIIGMAAVAEGFPLYYDGANEYGLAMAGLNFPGNAHYFPLAPDRDNVAPFELIPWVLGQCRNLKQARQLLERVNLCHTPFSPSLPLTPLHWMIADREGALVVESMADGLHVHDNPVGVLTNNPPFDYQLTHLCDYQHLSPKPPENRFGEVPLAPYGKGMGAMGLPGDWSPASRFVRAAFAKAHAVSGPEEAESVGQFFHIMGTVEHPRGVVALDEGRSQITVYTSCINTDRGIYYYITYENRRISAVDLRACPLDGQRLLTAPLLRQQEICWQRAKECTGNGCEG